MDFSIFIPTIEIGPPYVGPMAGLRRYSYSLVQSLANQGVNIYIATTTKLSSDDELSNRENIHFYYLPEQISARGAYSTLTHFNAKNHRSFSKQAFEVYSELISDVDISLIHATEVAAYNFAKAKKNKELKIPLVVSVHGAVTTGNLKSRLWVKRPYSRLLRRLVKHCDKIITTSESLLDKIKRLSKTMKDKVIIMPHSLNCKTFSMIPKLEDIEAFRDKYDLDQSNSIVLMLGPYINRKSQHAVIRNFPEILKRNSEITFLVIGNGPLLSKIKEDVVNLEIEDSVIITGYVDDKELLLAYHISDVLLYPAVEGSFGTPLIEAMASGLPVIAVDKPPMNEMIPPKCDWLYPANDEIALVDKLLDIIRNKERSQEVAFNSQQHALKKFDTPVVGKNLVKSYNKIIKESQ
jgi:1,2-diacylglycerol 3-alpha-glucosyltransferase